MSFKLDGDGNLYIGAVKVSSVDASGNITFDNDVTITGTLAGVSALMVGLGNVDNTSDANKPVSTAQQTALDLKANIANFTSTGIDDNAASTALEIDSSGHMMSSSGVTLGNGLVYSASNNLDDYEEGSFTPTIVGGTLTISGSPTATYTKIGRVVTIECKFNLNADGDTTQIVVGGMPFTSSASSVSIANIGISASTVTNPHGRINAAALTVNIHKDAQASLTQDEIEGGNFYLTMTYNT